MEVFLDKKCQTVRRSKALDAADIIALQVYFF